MCDLLARWERTFHVGFLSDRVRSLNLSCCVLIVEERSVGRVDRMLVPLLSLKRRLFFAQFHTRGESPSLLFLFSFSSPPSFYLFILSCHQFISDDEAMIERILLAYQVLLRSSLLNYCSAPLRPRVSHRAAQRSHCAGIVPTRAGHGHAPGCVDGPDCMG